MLSGWIRKNSRSAGLTAGQCAGATAVVLMVAALLVLSLLYPAPDREKIRIAHGDPSAGPLAVAVNDGAASGIFYLPEKAQLSDALQAAGLPDKEGFAPAVLTRPLQNGMAIAVRRQAGLKPEVVTGMMGPEMRLALDMPVDINTASASDLRLIPGIGEKTAAKIIAFRQERKRLRSIDELLAVKGIKEKRLARLKKYLCVAVDTATGRGE